MTSLSELNWATLASDWDRLRDQHLRDMFDNATSDRFASFSRSFDDMTMDFSCERIDKGALENLLDLARVCEVEIARDAMYNGDAQMDLKWMARQRQI